MWDRCWSTAVVRLGLTTEQFFRLTPRQLRVLAEKDAERVEDERRHAELCAAIVAHTVATYAGKSLKKGKEVVYGEFMPSFRRELEEQRRQQAALSFHAYLQSLKK